MEIFVPDDALECRIQSINEGTFGGGNLRGPNIQPITHSYLLLNGSGRTTER
jgi:hypothetical protein